MRSELFAADNIEKESDQAGLRLQNHKMLKVELNGEIFARRGAMVGYQGQVQFEGIGAGGPGKWLRSKLTGEGVPIMKMKGRGDVFLANEAQDVHLFGRTFHFAAGETIHTENSYKYSIGQFRALARGAGWRAERVWTDARRDFSVHELILAGA